MIPWFDNFLPNFIVVYVVWVLTKGRCKKIYFKFIVFSSFKYKNKKNKQLCCYFLSRDEMRRHRRRWWRSNKRATSSMIYFWCALSRCPSFFVSSSFSSARPRATCMTLSVYGRGVKGGDRTFPPFFLRRASTFSLFSFAVIGITTTEDMRNNRCCFSFLETLLHARYWHHVIVWL